MGLGAIDILARAPLFASLPDDERPAWQIFSARASMLVARSSFWRVTRELRSA